ncbi:pilus assembly PilX family protein [Thalassotalea sp. ND16A]|uniref:pilus assembly PilX family protein n=1 Tax=Thalassotalea sp. ND16A TaxID=1535422 RepID=UPI00051D98EC|nr:hypothetical protein [Thalassotalea sp. ND16A]KGJ88147.1 hypothetical protein ND16A_2700 [Thalassotalea sp. ND16A]
MNNITNNNRTLLPIKQHGAVLGVSLVVLVLITLVGLSSFQSSMTQSLMSANSQFQSLAFNDAERSLVEAEEALEAQVLVAGAFDFNTADDGYYSADEALNVFDINWDTHTAAETGKTADDKYIIKYQGLELLPGEDESLQNNNAPIIGSSVHTFIVTSRSKNLKRAERVLQSVYITSEQP